MSNLFKNTKFIVVFTALFASGIFFYKIAFNEADVESVNVYGITPKFKNFILIGWDGVQRERLHELLNAGKLPNLEKLIVAGSISDISITTGETKTKPGWSEILTGYSPEITGVYSNFDYEPIPRGYTIFERLETYFGKNNIVTLFVGGKNPNIGARGPHKICTNCLKRYSDTGEKTEYWRENTSVPTLVPGKERVFVQKEGEPYYNAKDALDVYEVGLGSAENVGPEVLHYIEEYKDQRFFAFFHFREPDELGGHIYGENSKEYKDGIITDDYWLGEIVNKLKALGIYEETLIYVTSDHGFDKDKKRHDNAPYVFLATNDPLVTKKEGDRKDITPTILYRYGIDVSSIEPPLEGALLISEVQPVRIGYFNGGRVNMIYRTFIHNYFKEEGIDVELYTKFLKEDDIFKIPGADSETGDIWKDKSKISNPFGKMTGIKIVEKIMAGEFDGGTIGESSFVHSINNDLPIVAVAMLGYDAVPGKAILMRSDVKINSPDDFKGKTLVSRRAGPGDAIFLREFLKDIGLVANKDVTVMDQVDDYDTKKWLEEKKIDGGLYHLIGARRLVQSGTAYVYRPMDWMDSALSHAVLVFHKDYIESHREEVQKVVDAYVKRIMYEKNLPDEEKDKSWSAELMMEGEFRGMKIPAYDLPPKIKVELLKEMQDLLFEYGEIDKKVNIKDFIDNSFVEKAWEKLN